MENSLPNGSSCVTSSEKNHEAAEEESYPEEIELKTKKVMKIEDLHNF